jgi:hypothetical protein
MMEEVSVGFSFYETLRLIFPEDSHPYTRSRENLKLSNSKGPLKDRGDGRVGLV